MCDPCQSWFQRSASVRQPYRDAKEIFARHDNQLPRENTVYFGDVGRAPYGLRSPEVIQRFSEQLARYLVENYNIKLLVAACNTISAVALDHLKKILSVDIEGVIDSIPPKAISSSRNGKIGVIGTERTIKSGVYQDLLHRLDEKVKIYTQPCSLFVPLIEQGWENEPATKLIAKDYLAYLKHSGIDTLILGCTHYPIISHVIQKYLGEGVTIIDPATECAKIIKDHLQEKNELNKDSNNPSRLYFVTDNPESFKTCGERYLQRKIHNVSLVDIMNLEKILEA